MADSDNDDKDVVEGYIWESMQRNAQRMQQLKTEKGIVDPIELERELLRNFKTNEVMPLPNEPVNVMILATGQQQPDDHQNISGTINCCNQDEQKFTSSYIIDTTAKADDFQPSADQTAHNVQEQMQQ